MVTDSSTAKPDPEGASMGMGLVERDRLSYDLYHSIQCSGRGDWINLINVAPLASQYHLSAPYAYLPITLQQPAFTESSSEASESIALNVQSVFGGVFRTVNTNTESQQFDHDTHPTLHDSVQFSCMDASAVYTMNQVALSGAAGGAKTSDSHPISVSYILPPQSLASISEKVLAALPPAYRKVAGCAFGRCFDEMCDTRPHTEHEQNVPFCSYLHCGEQIPRQKFAERLSCALAHSDEHLRGQLIGEQLIRLPPSVALDAVIDNVAPAAEDAYETLYGEQLAQREAAREGKARIGNMLLSSCPGKKVRLNGPVRGRSSVCRDLKSDLQRYRALGVRAIVCCLDDEELSQLGTPFAKYEPEVAAQGIDLVRLPIAEGFAPTDLVKFDIMMTALILNYTLRGASILVHCRGGVGRAGLVACIWILKMGLVSVHDHLHAPRPCCSLIDVAYGAQGESVQVLQTVIKMIEVIRRQRSPRAIETAEQALFLLEYTRFIHRQEYGHKMFQACGVCRPDL
ncbi:hypothetical protein MVES_001827 [Malassezia vespertilionis]|uniref:Tyrosine specific protein phosphatases domain-containing protein n=1 Tax=Malassezia vespertilionis TaxID=2020962 RepID=A0A2N1JDE3_9BASI|nr:hypothetical protein MVES_001827 [Malassezia vespertilionis]